MFIAHAPAGYILGTSLVRRLTHCGIAPRVLILACVLGALAPDLDMLYFFLVDGRQTHHHKYFSHWPIVWLGLTLVAALWARFARQKSTPLAAVLFCVSGVIHLILDTLVGDIWWLAPFVDKSYVLFVVPALFKPWWLSFILHWSFAVELGLLVVALMIYRKRAKLKNAVMAITTRPALSPEPDKSLPAGGVESEFDSRQPALGIELD